MNGLKKETYESQMVQVIIQACNTIHPIAISITNNRKVVDVIEELSRYQVPELQVFQDFYITNNGHIIDPNTTMVTGQTYHVLHRLVGGKGGFGSMLRAIGAQIEKTTNREACRDLSGRRMRDVNYEKEMKDWMSKKGDREREKEEKKQARIARRRAMPHYKFDDSSYMQQTATVAEGLSSALDAGIAASRTKKRKIPETVTSSKTKKSCEWLGVNESDLDSDDSESRTSPSDTDAANPCSSGDSSHEHASSDTIPDDLEKGTNDPNDLPESCQKTDKSDINNDGKCADEHPTVSSTSTRVTGSPSVTQKSENEELSSDINPSKHGLLQQLDSVGVSREGMQSLLQTSTDDPKPGCYIADLQLYHDASELEAFGLDCLKQSLLERGLKCGGSLKERAQRLFSVKGLSHEQIDPSLFAKGKNGVKKGNSK